MFFVRFKQNSSSTKRDSKRRLYVLGGVLAFIALSIISRLAYLHISDRDFLRKQGNARTVRVVSIPSYRGVITDRRGTPLAVSTPMDSIWMNPHHFEPTLDEVLQLSELLELPPEVILRKHQHQQKKHFVYLKRAVKPLISEKISELNLKGIGVQREFRRFYPAGNSVSQLIGFTDINDTGQAGLELSYDEILKPIPGKKRVLEDQRGHWVQDIESIQMPKSGQDIKLSIDLRIQSLALTELERAIKRFKAKSGTLVMLDIPTGEVLAMVTAPSFNPNNLHERKGARLRNRAVTDQLEPGSTLKAFSMVSALDSELFSPKTIIDTSPGVFPIGANQVRDVTNFGKLTLENILVKSSNIGISKITLATEPQQLLKTLEKFGLGTYTLTNFPGETSGVFPKATENEFVRATIAFGYGLAVTPLQLVDAYATLARKGIKQPVSLLKLPNDTTPYQERIVKEEHAESVMQMLAKVMLQKGTGRRANIPGFKTAGKTGTIRVVGREGYDPNRHIGMFVGITPVNNPRLATAVIIEEPSENQYYGGLVAAPVYSTIVGKALHMLNVSPDNA